MDPLRKLIKNLGGLDLTENSSDLEGVSIKVIERRSKKENIHKIIKDYNALITVFLTVYRRELDLNYKDNEKSTLDALLVKMPEDSSILLATNILTKIKTNN